MLWLNHQLRKHIPELEIHLTDYYPNLPAFRYTSSKSNNFTFSETAVDARNVPSELIGFRTQLLSLHHFRPKDALKILQNAVDTKQGIGIFEAQERSVPSIIAMLFSPITVLLTTPFIKPFKLGRIIFTYLIPIVPLFVLWDGIVSCLRTYSVKEMKTLVSKVKNHNNFKWVIKRIKSGPSIILYLIEIQKH